MNCEGLLIKEARGNERPRVKRPTFQRFQDPYAGRVISSGLTCNVPARGWQVELGGTLEFFYLAGRIEEER